MHGLGEICRINGWAGALNALTDSKADSSPHPIGLIGSFASTTANVEHQASVLAKQTASWSALKGLIGSLAENLRAVAGTYTQLDRQNGRDNANAGKRNFHGYFVNRRPFSPTCTFSVKPETANP